ncbi:MAG TPA: hypothetical protein VF735_21470 [Pyrinomonadaceae bacterium]|jgi:hypothetical protein
MKNLPVFNLQDAEHRELQRRINLANRPVLGSKAERVDNVTRKLAANSADRARFVQNPAAYLKEQAIPVSKCNLVASDYVRTTEAGDFEDELAYRNVSKYNLIYAVNVEVVVNVAVVAFFALAVVFGYTDAQQPELIAGTQIQTSAQFL